MRSLALLALLVAVQYCTAVGLWKNIFKNSQLKTHPSFCKTYECPEYSVIKEFEGYELREYSPSVWMSIQLPVMESDFWEDHLRGVTSHAKMWAYIHGYNDRDVIMEMTVPVLLTHTKESVYFNYMLPRAYANNPPKPTSSNIKPYYAKKGLFYVRTFSGFAYGLFGTQNNFKNETSNFKTMLTKDGASFNEDMFFTAEYDSSWVFKNRHNEIWMLKKD